MNMQNGLLHDNFIAGHDEVSDLFAKIFPEIKTFKLASKWFYIFLVDDNQLIGIVGGGVNNKIIINYIGLLKEFQGSGLEKYLLDYLKKEYPNKEIKIEKSKI